LTKLGDIWKKVSNFGNKESLSIDESFNLILINVLCILGIFFSLVNLIFYAIKSAPISIAISFSFLTLLCILLVLNVKHYFTFVKISIITLISTFISFIYLNYGSSIEIIPMYFVLMLLSFLMFKNIKHQILSISFIASLLFGVKFYIHFYGRINEVELTLESPLTFLCVSLFSFVFLIQTIKLRYNNYIDQKNESVERLKDINQKYKASQLLLKKSNETLDDKNKELEQFVFIASHDLKAPLRNIISFTSLIKKKLDAIQNDEVDNYLSFINESGTKMNLLIDSILNYGKIKKLRQEDKGKIDLNAMIKEISLMLIQNHSKEIKIYCEDLPSIYAHKVAIEQLLNNIIENGIKYNEAQLPSIKIWAESEEDTFTLCIKDNGIGIEEKYIETVFEMFKRLHTSAEFEGTGIGLAICKKIVEMHDGNITIESKKNKGSIFKLQFPISILRYSDERIKLKV